MGGQTRLHLPRDIDGASLAIYSVDDTTIVTGTISGTADTRAVPADAECIELTLEGDVYIVFGDSSVLADNTSRRLFRGTHLYTLDVQKQTHISVLQLTVADTGGWTMAKLT